MPRHVVCRQCARPAEKASRYEAIGARIQHRPCAECPQAVRCRCCRVAIADMPAHVVVGVRAERKMSLARRNGARVTARAPRHAGSCSNAACPAAYRAVFRCAIGPGRRSRITFPPRVLTSLPSSCPAAALFKDNAIECSASACRAQPCLCAGNDVFNRMVEGCAQEPVNHMKGS